MPRLPRVPPALELTPFRGSTAIADGLLTTTMLKGRSWRRLLPDIYLHRSASLDHRAWCDAVVLTLPAGAGVGGLSAARLWGVDLLDRETPVSIVVPRTGRVRRNARIRVHYTTLRPGDLITLAGLPVTTPERTAFDLGRRLPRTEALIAVDAMLHRKVIRLEALQTLAAQRNRWPGVPRLDEVLRLADPGSESPMESRLRLLLLDAGLPPAIAQFEVRDRNGRLIGRVDLAWPELRLAVEYEGDHHRERAQFRRDVTRLNALRAAGWTVLRVTADQLLLGRAIAGRSAARQVPAVRLVTGAMSELKAGRAAR